MPTRFDDSGKTARFDGQQRAVLRKPHLMRSRVEPGESQTDSPKSGLSESGLSESGLSESGRSESGRSESGRSESGRRKTKHSRAEIAAAGAMPVIRLLNSPLGWVGFVVGPHGIQQTVFDCQSAAEVQQRLNQVCSNPFLTQLKNTSSAAANRGETSGSPLDGDQMDQLADRLERSLVVFTQGEPPDWDQLPLDLRHCTQFQRNVIRVCRNVPFGQTISYGALADSVGSPRAARAVGSVMAKNRLPLIVPCHRVIGSGGALHGFSSRGGITMKQRLLALETSWGGSRARF